MEELEQRVAQLMAQGRKIDAIAALREATGLGLAEAKAAVERHAEGGPLLDAPAAAAPRGPVELPEDVRQLAASGHVIEAVKRLRAQTGLGLKDAKDLVDTVPRAPGARRTGCGAAALLLLVGLGALAARLAG